MPRQVALRRLLACLLLGLASLGADGLAGHASAASFRESDPPLLIRNAGPEKAKGVIYFLYAWQPEGGTGHTATVPYFMVSMNRDGYDVIGAHQPDFPTAKSNHDAREDAILPSAGLLRQRIAELRKAGYERVIVGGQAWGAWVEMVADGAKGGLGADALVLIAPAAYGGNQRAGGRANRDFGRNLSEFDGVLKAVHTPTVLMTFAEDALELGERGSMAKAQFAKAGIPALIIDKPKGFTGHLAAWIPLFDYVRGSCIYAFLETLKEGDCRIHEPPGDDPRSIFKFAQLAGRNLSPIASGEELARKSYYSYMLGNDFRLYRYINSTQRIVQKSGGPSREALSFRDGLECIGEKCTRLVRWSDSWILEFDPKGGDIIAWWAATEQTAESSPDRK